MSKTLLIDCLKRRELALRGEIVALVAAGVPAALVGPFILSNIYWLIAFIWGFYVPWSFVQCCGALVLLPLLFWTEWLTHGAFYSDAVLSAFGNGPVPPTGFTDVDALVGFIRNPRPKSIGLVELFLWGPRQLLDAADKVRHVRLFARVSRGRAADILQVLMNEDHATVTGLAEKEGGSVAALPALAYLIWYEWIGISRDGQRVWLESDSRMLIQDRLTRD